MNPKITTAISSQSAETAWNKKQVTKTVETVPNKTQTKIQTDLQNRTKASYILSSIQTVDFTKSESIIKAAIRNQFTIKKICLRLLRIWIIKNHSRSIKKSLRTWKSKFFPVWTSKIFNSPNKKHKIPPKLSTMHLIHSPRINLLTP